MCLDKITRRKGFNTSGVGYKVFRLFPGGKLTSVYREQDYSLKRGEWLPDVEHYYPYITSPISRIRYEKGWHFFFNKKDATWFKDSYYMTLMSCEGDRTGFILTVKKVKFRKLHTRGIDTTKRVGVAEEIYIYD